MLLPKYNIISDQKLDESLFLEFYNTKNPLINEYFPQVKREKDVLDATKFIYKNPDDTINKTISFLENNINSLDEIAKIISNKLNCSWDDINKITIIPSVCPICPRWINENKFMVCYFYHSNVILRICAHEMIHLLYFNKLKESMNQNINTEYPSQDWLISEIVAPIITGSQEIQKIVNNKEEPFLLDAKIAKPQIDQIISLFNKEPNIIKFRHEAAEILKQKSY